MARYISIAVRSAVWVCSCWPVAVYSGPDRSGNGPGADASPAPRRGQGPNLADGQLTTRVGRLVTRRHDELADLGQHFNQMAARLEALLTSQQLLFRNVSHELRSPLARVQVALGLLRQHTGAEAARYLERIEREVDRLNRLIGQLLTLARLESGVEVTQDEVCDLRALVQEVVADGDFEAQARQGAVTLVSAEAYCVSGTTELLRSAIENVVRNAVRYTTAGTTTDVRVYGHGAPAARGHRGARPRAGGARRGPAAPL